MSICSNDYDNKHSEHAPSFRVMSRPQKIQRLHDRRTSSVDLLLAAARDRGYASTLDASAWTLDEISGPNVTDKESILSFAKMTLDAYTMEPSTGEWKDVNGGFNYSDSFGWEGDGLRGHIFADDNNSTIVIALKGTSPGWSSTLMMINYFSQRLMDVQQFSMVQKRRQMTKLTTIYSFHVVVLSKDIIYGGKFAIAKQAHTHAIRVV